MPSLVPKTAMGYMRFHLPKQLPLFLAMVVSSAFSVIAQRDSAGTEEQARKIFPKFIETSSALGINFRNMASHTSKKYLIETMGAGVALFDYDNDGRLDIFVVNGAPLNDTTSNATIPQYAGPNYWHRPYHQKQGRTLEDDKQYVRRL